MKTMLDAQEMLKGLGFIKYEGEDEFLNEYGYINLDKKLRLLCPMILFNGRVVTSFRPEFKDTPLAESSKKLMKENTDFNIHEAIALSPSTSLSYFLYEWYSINNLIDNKQDQRKVMLNIRQQQEDGFIFNDVDFIKTLNSTKDGAEDLALLHEMYTDDTITIYRGEDEKSNSYKSALSWTLSLDMAKFFANRYNKTNSGKVYQATVAKEDILAYLPEREEEEVIVKSPDLINVEQIL